MNNLGSSFTKEDINQALPNWTHRRLVVKWSLLLNAFVFLMVSIVTSFCILWITLKHLNISIPSNLTNIIDNILYIIGLMTTSIIGSYVFGAQWDINKFRGFITNIFGSNSSSNNSGE
jgi:multidrug transporter EmrE-like cation transporter